MRAEKWLLLVGSDELAQEVRDSVALVELEGDA